MHEAKSSRTAAYVAFLRALGDRGVTTALGFHDAPARALLPSAWARALSRFGPKISALPAFLRRRVVAHVDLLVVRALAIDVELERALACGARQVVVLGAGFDSRAYRMSALDRAHVFEVDHPATQAEKQGRASGLSHACRELTYVACDFVRDDLAERLASAGHRSAAPTIWIWEGVTLYLDDDALRSSLRAIVAGSAPGSTLLVEYHDADVPRPLTLYSATRKALLAFWAEPQIGRRTQRAFRAELERAGLRLEKDFALSKWGEEHAGATSRSREGTGRLAVART